jgi:hypothetical protein
MQLNTQFRVAFQRPPPAEMRDASLDATFSCFLFGPHSYARLDEAQVISPPSGSSVMSEPSLSDFSNSSRDEIFLFFLGVRPINGARARSQEGPASCPIDGCGVLRLRGGSSAVRDELSSAHDDPHVVIPNSVKFLDWRTLARDWRIDLDDVIVTFEPGSRVKGISALCFSRCSLKSLRVPRSVEFLGDDCFRQTLIDEITFEPDSELTLIGGGCFLRSSLRSICIPRSVEVLRPFCFADCRNLESLSFESDSRLSRIEKQCFALSPLKSFRIPMNVGHIDGSAFNYTQIRAWSISIDPANRRFVVDRSFLIDVIDAVAVRYFGLDDEVVLWKEIQIVGHWCFCRSSIKHISFESESKLMQIEEFCLYGCARLERLDIPRSVVRVDQLGDVRTFIVAESESYHVLNRRRCHLMMYGLELEPPEEEDSDSS